MRWLAFFLAAENLLRQLLIEMKPGAALLVLDDRRMKAGRGDVLCCQQIEPPPQAAADEEEGTEADIKEGERGGWGYLRSVAGYTHAHTPPSLSPAMIPA